MDRASEVGHGAGEPVSVERLREFLAPRSIALVGASESSAWTRLAIASNERIGFRGTLELVHPRAATVFGRRPKATLRDLEQPVDLAFILASAPHIPAIVDDMAATGVRNGVVLASGFRESGADGLRLERSVRDLAASKGVVLLGPNCVGFVNSHARVAPFSLPFPPFHPGPIGIATQSGALATHMMTYALARGIGVSTLVSLGNGMMIGAADIVDALLEDAETKAVCLFLETVGDPDRFAAVATRADRVGKPLIALKVGSSAGGQRAARSHTGAVAGDDAVTDAALRQMNVIRVRSLEEMLDTAAVAAYYGRPRGRKVGVVSASGGACGIIADRLADEGLELPELAVETTEAVAPLLPPYAAVQNPLDVTAVSYGRAGQGPRVGSQPRSLMAVDHAMGALVDDPGLDMVLYTGIPRPPDRPAESGAAAAFAARIDWVASRIASAAVPVYPVALTCTDVGDYYTRVAGNHLPLLAGLDGSIRAIGNIVRWVERAGTVQFASPTARPAAAGLPSRASAGGGSWSEDSSREWLSAHGVPVVPAELTRSPDEAVAAARRLGGRVVLKVCSRDIPHKSDIGGVRVGVESEAEIRSAFGAVAAAGRSVPRARVDGVLVSSMCPAGIELFAGVTRDPVFGPVLAVGLGGVWIETLEDVAIRVLPVDAGEVVAMLTELRGAALLRGARGTPAADLDAVADAVARICTAAAALEASLESLEVNPLWVRGGEVLALDALVVTAARGALDMVLDDPLTTIGPIF